MTELNEAARIAEEARRYSEPGSRMAILARAVLDQGEALAAAQQALEKISEQRPIDEYIFDLACSALSSLSDVGVAPSPGRVVAAARQIDSAWDSLNGTLTVGHPFAQELRAALASLSDRGEQ